jgi:hypothetical protein
MARRSCALLEEVQGDHGLAAARRALDQRRGAAQPALLHHRVEPRDTGLQALGDRLVVGRNLRRHQPGKHMQAVLGDPKRVVAVEEAAAAQLRNP